MLFQMISAHIYNKESWIHKRLTDGISRLIKKIDKQYIYIKCVILFLLTTQEKDSLFESEIRIFLGDF